MYDRGPEVFLQWSQVSGAAPLPGDRHMAQSQTPWQVIINFELAQPFIVCRAARGR